MNATARSACPSGNGSSAAFATRYSPLGSASRAARDHRLGRVEPDGAVPELLQVASHPPFAAADVDRQATGSGDEFEETVAMKPPVAVVSGLPRPADPVGRVSLPGIPEVHHGSLTVEARRYAETMARDEPTPHEDRRDARARVVDAGERACARSGRDGRRAPQLLARDARGACGPRPAHPGRGAGDRSSTRGDRRSPGTEAASRGPRRSR